MVSRLFRASCLRLLSHIRDPAPEPVIEELGGEQVVQKPSSIENRVEFTIMEQFLR